MKARNKRTGEIINVIPMDGGWAANLINGVRHFEDSELDFSFEDWVAFRREAAKDILPALIEKASEIYEFESLVKEVWCKQAVEWADELIKQLKEEKNNDYH